MEKRIIEIDVKAVVLSLVLLVGILFLSACSNSPEKTIEKFQESIENRDPEALYDLVVLDDDTYWTNKEASHVIEKFHEYHDDYIEQLTLLDEQLEALKNKTMLFNENGLFYFNDDEVLKVRKYELKIDEEVFNNGADKVTVKINNDKEIEIDDNKDISLGLFGPGVYEVYATVEYPYAQVEGENVVTITSLQEFIKEVDLKTEERYIDIKSNVPDTTLLVNEKEVDFEFTTTDEGVVHLFGNDEENGDSFGPVSEGIKLQGIAKLPWGEVKSEEIKVTQDDTFYEISPNVLGNQEMKNKVTKKINNYAKNKIEAYVNLDANVLKGVSDLIKKPIERDIEETLYYHEFYPKDEYQYKGEALGTRIDYSRVEYVLGEGGRHYIHIPVEFYESLSHPSSSNTDSKANKQYRKEIVELEYIEEDENWIITEVSKDNIDDNQYMRSDEVVKTEF